MDADRALARMVRDELGGYGLTVRRFGACKLFAAGCDGAGGGGSHGRIMGVRMSPIDVLEMGRKADRPETSRGRKTERAGVRKGDYRGAKMVQKRDDGTVAFDIEAEAEMAERMPRWPKSGMVCLVVEWLRPSLLGGGRL